MTEVAHDFNNHPSWCVYWNKPDLLVCPFMFLSLRFSNIKICVTLFLGTVKSTKLRFGTYVDNGWMYCVYLNQAAAAYLSLYLFI